MSKDERTGGRLTFAFFLLIGTVWFGSSTATHGFINTVGVAGLGVSIAVGAIIGMMVGFYNFGRARGN